MASKLVGASVWEEELFEHLTSHADNERDLLTAYQEAAAESGSAAFRYLTSLITEDEVRHHRVSEELAESLRAYAECRPGQAKVPRLDHWGDNEGHVIAVTERLLGQEEQDERELRRLAKELKDVKDTTLWRLLVEVMEMDTAKHIAILRFAHKHARHD